MRRRGDVSEDESTGRELRPLAAAPGTPARRASGVRLRAAAALLLCAGSLATLSSYAWRHRVDARAFDARRITLPAPAWRSVLTVTSTTERACPPSVPVVVLYVTSTCPHCMAELRRWATLVRTGAPEIACTGVAVVAPPVNGNSSTGWLPPELVSMLLWDHDGTVAHALDIRLVPLAAYVTSKGIAVSRVVGETSENATIQHLFDLRRISNGEGGAH